jgi:hypothetical protein
MKNHLRQKHLLTFVLALVVGVLGFAVVGIATAGNGNPPSPPGQGECEHGNSGKPCKDDPQPEHGKDCEEHGNLGGVNEDHCKGEETTPTETTPTETTPTETTPTETTPTETTPTETTPTETTVTQTTPDEAASPESESESSNPPPSIVGTPPKAQNRPVQVEQKPAKTAVAGFVAKGEQSTAPKPTRQPQPAPFTL